MLGGNRLIMSRIGLSLATRPGSDAMQDIVSEGYDKTHIAWLTVRQDYWHSE